MELLAQMNTYSGYYRVSNFGGPEIFSMFFLLCVCCLAILAVGLFVYLLIDVFQRDFGSDQSGLILGIILLVFLGFPIGYIVYFFAIMQRYPKKNANLASPKAKS